MFLYQVDAVEKSSIILSRTRTNAGISRRGMSELLKVSVSTIKAWESGQGTPTLSTILAWFDIVGENPFSYMLEFFWPDAFKSLCFNSSDEVLRNALLVYISEVMGPREIKKLHFLIMGNYGGSWKGVLDMFCAHSHTSLHNRYKIAEIIQTSFDLSKNSKTSSDLDLFDDKLLCHAISAARNAALAHKPGYAVLREKHQYAKVSSEIMKKARIDVGVSHLYLAKALGKTERTIQKWENSIEPSFIDVCLWFHVLGKPLWNYLREAIIIGENRDFNEDDKKLKQELYHYASNMDRSELRKLCFLIFWKHGSNWHSILELMIEHVNTPLSQRVISARSVLIGYEMDSNDAMLYEPIGILPDLENLKNCIEQETQVARDKTMCLA